MTTSMQMSKQTYRHTHEERERYTLDTGKTRWHLIELIT